MEGKTTSIVEKGLDPRRVMLGTIIPYYITVVNQRQDVRLEVKDQERLRKKPGKTPEEVHTMRHIGSNMVDVVGPSQSVIYKYTEKLETGHLLNLRTSKFNVLVPYSIRNNTKLPFRMQLYMAIVRSAPLGRDL